MIQVIRARRDLASSLGGDTFTGQVWKDPVLPRTDAGVGIANIHFAPGARTNWHIHEGGQILIAVAGEGLVGDADGTVRLSVGDIAWTPGGTAHWHGATTQRYLVHTAISLAGVEWLDPVDEADYVAAFAASL